MHISGVGSKLEVLNTDKMYVKVYSRPKIFRISLLRQGSVGKVIVPWLESTIYYLHRQQQ